MLAKVRAPASLTNKTLASSILQLLSHLIQQVGALNHFAMDCQSHFSSFSNDLCKQSALFESRIQQTAAPLKPAGVELTKTIQVMAQGLERQANKNQVVLKSLDSERDENLYKVVADKLNKFEIRIRHYEQVTRQLQELECKYQCKAQRFANMETDTVKYYSGAYYQHKLAKAAVMQTDLEKLLSELKNERLEIQFGCRQLKKLINELVGGLMRKMRETARIAKLVVGRLIGSEQVIVQESSQDDLTAKSSGFVAPSDRANGDYGGQYLQKLSTNFSSGQFVRESIIQYLGIIVNVMHNHYQAVMNLQRNSAFLTLQKGKYAVEGMMGHKMFEQFCDAQRQAFLYAAIIQKMAVRIDRTRPMIDLNSAQKLNFEEFSRAYQQVLSGYRPPREQQGNTLHLAYEQLQSNRTAADRVFSELKLMAARYSAKEESMNAKFRLECQNILHGLRELFKECQTQYQPHLLNRPSTIQETQVMRIYERRHFEALVDPFVLSEGDYNFQQSPHIETYLKLKNEADAEVPEPEQSRSMNLRDSFFNKCCGVVGGSRLKSPNAQDELKDQWNCALSYGILLQGKMYAYRKCLKFISIFNRKTFLGWTELQIPKKDILKVEGGKAPLNYYTIITTKHGELKFTSFIGSPLGALRDLYVEGKQYRQMSLKKLESTESPQMKEIHQKWAQALTVNNFSRPDNDTFTTEVNGYVCRSNIQRGPSKSLIEFQYKPTDGRPAPVEKYGIRLTQKPDGSISATFEHGPEKGSMAPHFVGLAIEILTEYGISSLTNLFSSQPVTVQLKREASKGAALDVGAIVSPFLMVTDSSTVVPTPRHQPLNPQPQLLQVPSKEDAQITLKNLRISRSPPSSSSNLILVNDREFKRSSAPLQLQSTTSLVSQQPARMSKIQSAPPVKRFESRPPSIVKQPSPPPQQKPIAVEQTSNNLFIYVSLLAVLIILFTLV